MADSYKALPPHQLNEMERKYLASRTEEQRELHEMAVKLLGSSYFVERTHGFRKWLGAGAPAATVGAGGAAIGGAPAATAGAQAQQKKN